MNGMKKKYLRSFDDLEMRFFKESILIQQTEERKRLEAAKIVRTLSYTPTTYETISLPRDGSSSSETISAQTPK
jgi:hypothetical protein